MTRPPPGAAHLETERSASYDRIYRIVSVIPRGKVMTYGQVAALADLPGHARQVGYALHRVPEELELPWHRVLNAQGRVSPRASTGSDTIQRRLLEGEGVIFDASNRIDLNRFLWEPADEELRASEDESLSGAARKKRKE